MSLSDSTWQDFATGKNVEETWVVWLFYDGGTNHIRISDRSFVQLGVPVHGFVKNMPTIRRSINLATSSAKLENVTLQLSNGLYNGDLFSAEVAPGGTRNYVNREVRIYSCLNGSAPGMRRFTGRLRGVPKWNADTVQLDLEPQQPWDFIKIPNVKAPSGRFFPVVYGDFAYNTSTPTSPGYCIYDALWPAAVDEITNEAIWCLMPQSYSTNAIRAHVHEPSMKRFPPVVDASESYLAATTAHGDGYRAGVDVALIHAIKFKPSSLSEATASTFTDPENAIDDPDADASTTYAEATVSTGTAELWLQAANSDFDIYDTVAGAIQFKIKTPLYFSRFGAPHPTLWISIDGGSSYIGQYQPTATGDVTVTWTIDETELPGGVLPQQIGFYLFVFGGTTAVTCRIKDVRIEAVARTALPISGMTDREIARATQRAKDKVEDQEVLYFGADGLTRSWTTGAVTEIHELHRDLLHRFAGYTATPDNWTALDTARSGWSCRWWTRPGEQIPLKEALAQAQLEGCFIFTWSAAGVGKYLFVKSSYSSGDVAATLTEGVDCSTIEWGHVPFNELVTHQIVSYDPDPAEDGRYRATPEELVNSTARTAWNIQTEENIEQRELDMLVASVDDHCAYYDTVFGDLKRTGSCRITNHACRVLEVGDVIQIAGDSAYYMIVDERCRPGSLDIQFREVG